MLSTRTLNIPLTPIKAYCSTPAVVKRPEVALNVPATEAATGYNEIHYLETTWTGNHSFADAKSEGESEFNIDSAKSISMDVEQYRVNGYLPLPKLIQKK